MKLISDHITLLEPSALNTHFPAWIHQKPQDSFLHLAGCSSVFRIEAFRVGFASLCSAYRLKSDTHPHQLGLTQEYLAELERNQPIDTQAANLLRRMESSKSLQASDIQKFRDELRNLFQRGEGFTGGSEHEQHPVLIRSLRLVYEMAKNRTSEIEIESLAAGGDEDHIRVATYAVIDTLETLCGTAFELSVRLSGWDLISVLIEIQPHIDQLISLTKFSLEDKYRKVLYYKFKHGEFCATAYQQIGDVDSFISSLEETLLVWNEMHDLKFYGYGRGVQYADPYAEGIAVMWQLGIQLCQRQQYIDGLDLFHRASVLQEEIWPLGKLHRWPLDIKDTFISLNKDALTCARSGQASLRAKKILKRLQILGENT